MVQLNSFSAVHYRGIDGLSIENLSKANLITGQNGVGKTALIEAMWLFTGRYNPSSLWNANVQRSQNPILNPLSRLTDDMLEVGANEDGNYNKLSFAFETTNENVPSINVAGNHDRNQKQMEIPPVIGTIHAHIDGSPEAEMDRSISITPLGSGVMPESW